ncbi:MAG: hypothetical protein L0Z50_20675 [Verrucomicrobiales bacterium]|nr:hypothetical protein [Verrucomicrobiales bacterium]
MKNRTVIKKFSWLLAIGFASALVFSGCKSTGEHPQGEHPKKELSATNAPARNP